MNYPVTHPKMLRIFRNKSLINWFIFIYEPAPKSLYFDFQLLFTAALKVKALKIMTPFRVWINPDFQIY